MVLHVLQGESDQPAVHQSAHLGQPDDGGAYTRLVLHCNLHGQAEVQRRRNTGQDKPRDA